MIELLTVIAIIGILAAILIPVVGKVRNTARTSATVNNLRQLGTAALLFAGDNKGRFPLADIDGAPAGQRYWPHRLAAYLSLNPNASRGVFLSPSDQVTRRDTNLSATATVPTSFSVQSYLWGTATQTGDVITPHTSRRGVPLNSVKRPSQTIMIITGQPMVLYSPSTGLSDGATASFSQLPHNAAFDTSPAALDTPITPLNNTNGWEQIGYYVGSDGTAKVENGVTGMTRDGRAAAVRADGSTRLYRFGEILVRDINVIQ